MSPVKNPFDFIIVRLRFRRLHRHFRIRTGGHEAEGGELNEGERLRVLSDKTRIVI